MFTDPNSRWISRVPLIVGGVVSGAVFAYYAFACAFFVSQGRLVNFEPTHPIAHVNQDILCLPGDNLHLTWVFPVLTLALAGLPRIVFDRLKWVIVFIYVSQIVAARTFAFLLKYFSHSIDDVRLVSTFSEIREGMTDWERWLYSSLVDLLERGWGYWAVALHSIVLGAFGTLVVCGVYRVMKRPVLARWAARKTKTSGLEAR